MLQQRLNHASNVIYLTLNRFHKTQPEKPSQSQQNNDDFSDFERVSKNTEPDKPVQSQQ